RRPSTRARGGAAVAETTLPYASGMVALPLLVALALRLGLGLAAPRRWALVAGLGALALALGAFAEAEGGPGGRFLADPWVPAGLGFGVGDLGAILLPFAALIGLAAILASPRTQAHARQIARILVAE